jgi:ATP-dependent helicase HrpA
VTLTYQFEPGTAADGVTAHVPLAVLNRLPADGFDRQVPGLQADLVTALLRSLPKDLRKRFVPAPDTAAWLLTRLPHHDPHRPLTEILSEELQAATGVVVPPDAWDPAKVPEHLRLTFRVEDADGAVLAEGKDLTALRERLAPTVRSTVAEAAADVERTGLTAWSIGALPDAFERQVDGQTVRGVPALVDEGDTVALRVLGTAVDARRAHRRGVRRLLTLTVPSPVKHVLGRLDPTPRLALGANPHGSVPALLADCVDAAVDALAADDLDQVRDAAAFDRLRDRVRGDLAGTTYDVVRTVADVLVLSADVSGRLDSLVGDRVAPAVDDERAHLARLIRPGFVTRVGRDRLPHLRRYLRAVVARLDALPTDPVRDATRQSEVAAVEAEVDAWLARLPARRRDDADVVEVTWMVEELRVSLFAQRLGTAYPVSAKRIAKAMAALSS